jgi:hypothetical protein
MLRRRNWKGIFRAAVNPSMEAAGKTSLFFTPRKIPFQSRHLVICLTLSRYFGLGSPFRRAFVLCLGLLFKK